MTLPRESLSATATYIALPSSELMVKSDQPNSASTASLSMDVLTLLTGNKIHECDDDELVA
jgi:hypothetical protein